MIGPWRKSFWRDVRGVVAVEFAFTGTLFVGVLLAIAQIGFIGIAQSQLEYVTRNIARQVMTGQVDSDVMAQSDFTALVKKMLGSVFDPANVVVTVYPNNSLNTKISNPALFDSNGKVATSWQFDTGNNGDVMVIQIMYRMPILLGSMGGLLSNLPDGTHLLIATSVVQNEP